MECLSNYFKWFMECLIVAFINRGSLEFTFFSGLLVTSLQQQHNTWSVCAFDYRVLFFYIYYNCKRTHQQHHLFRNVWACDINQACSCMSSVFFQRSQWISYFGLCDFICVVMRYANLICFHKTQYIRYRFITSYFCWI